MKYNELTATKFTKTSRKGRGISAGQGKTAGRGTKGQGARKSGGVRPGFEGGQMPLYMRIPKLRGFHSTRTRPSVVYTGQINSVGKAIIDTNALAEAGLIENPHVRVKLIANGEISKKLTVKLQLATTGAIKIVEKAGGKFEKVEQLKRLKTSKSSSPPPAGGRRSRTVKPVPAKV